MQAILAKLIIPGMPDLPRKKDAQLTPENLEESRRLKQLYLASDHGMSQAAFGAAYDIGNQGTVWQCLNGKGMPISLKAARGFARGLKVRIADFSPRLAAEAAQLSGVVSGIEIDAEVAQVAAEIADLPPPERARVLRLCREIIAMAKSGGNPSAPQRITSNA